MAERLLELRGVSKSFGGLRVHPASSTSHVDEGEIVSVIGPNGAGKTTLFNLITGVYAPDAGDIRLRRAEPARPRAAPDHGRGIARTFQTLRLFLNMTVKENVMAAAYSHTKRRHLPLDPAHARACGARSARSRELAEERLAFFGERLMGYRWNQPAYSLSYANRRRLEIARATATQPRLLLLDEPAAGMNPVETHEITELIARLRDGGRLHDPRDRARHARRRGHLRPRGRARPRRQDRRGDVRAGRDERRGWSRRTSARRGRRRSERATAPLLELDGRRHLLRADPHPPGRRTCRSRAGRARLPARRQRLGQVDDAEDDPRHRPAAQRHGRVRRRERDEAGRRATGSARGWRSCPRTAGCSRR